MIIWILALVLLACTSFVSFNVGVVRAAFSFLGLVAGTLAASIIGHKAAPLAGLFGVKNPVLLWALGPVIVWLIVLTLFKVGGFAVYQKVDHYYKYKAGDLRMGLWNRLDHRLGLCVGLMNGVVYLILICMPFYVVSYATLQLADSGQMTFAMKVVNSLGGQIQSSGMNKIEASIDPAPKAYYDAADLASLIYHNPLLESRLSHYPGFLALGQTPQFQDIGKDKEFTELRQKQPPFMEILAQQKAQAVLDSPELLKLIWATVIPDLKDLETYLRTAQSPKYDGEKILGSWSFNINGALAQVRKAKPTISSAELSRIKRLMILEYKETTLVATTEKTVFVKHLGILHPSNNPKLPPTVDFQDQQGRWETSGSAYQITGILDSTLDAEVEADKLNVTGGAFTMRFDKEY